MSFHTFDLPVPDEGMGKVDERLTAQQALLDYVNQSLGEALVNRLVGQEADINTVAGKINRSINSRLKTQEKNLGKVITPIQDTLIARLAQQGINLQSINSPVPIQGSVADVQQTDTVPSTFDVGPATSVGPVRIQPHSPIPPARVPPSGPPTSPPVSIPPTTNTWPSTNADLIAFCNNHTGVFSWGQIAVGVNPVTVFPVLGNPWVNWVYALHNATQGEINVFVQTHPSFPQSLCTGVPISVTPPPPPPPPSPTPPSPTPPEPPPEPPPVTECLPDIPLPSDCGTAPTPLVINLPDAPTVQGDWCTRFYTLRDYLSQVGAEVLSKTAQVDMIPNVDTKVFAGWALDAELSSRKYEVVTKALYNLETRGGVRAVIQKWVIGFRVTMQVDDDHVTNLLAVRCLLRMAEDFAVTQTLEGDADWQGGSDIAPTVVGIGAGVNMHQSAHNHFAGASTIKPLFVPFYEIIDRLIRASADLEVPDLAGAVEMYVMGQLTEDGFSCLVHYNGGVLDYWKGVAFSRRLKLTSEELIQFGRRTGMATEDILRNLRQLGWVNDDEAKAKNYLFDELPSIQEHLHWLQRNVFDDAYVHDYGLLDGFDDRFWAKFGQQLFSQGFTKDRAALHYAAHWVNPAPGQLGEMLQRNRPGRVPDDAVFREEDFLRILAEQDVAPYFRKRFLAIAYNRIGIRFLRQAFQTGAINVDELYELYQDLGYKPQDAKRLVDSDIILKVRTNATRGQGWTPAKLSKYFALKLIDDTKVTAEMTLQGYSTQEIVDLMDVAELNLQAQITTYSFRKATNGSVTSVLNAFEIGTIDRLAASDSLLGIGWTKEKIDPVLSTIDLKTQASLAKEAINSLKRSVLGGELTIQEASDALRAIGVSESRIETYTDLWDFKLRHSHKQIAAGKIVSLVGKGLLATDIARQRLINLGYTDPDSALLLSEASQRMMQTEAKALDQEGKTRARQAAAIEKAISTAEASKTRLQKQLCRTMPVGKLIYWYSRYLIGEEYFLSKLAFCGYTDEIAQDYLREAKQKRELYTNAKRDQLETTAKDVGGSGNGQSTNP
jgi:hypothetical protein